MRKLIITTVTTMLFLAGGSLAMAQGTTTGASTSSPNSSSGALPEAPVGHRQPRADQVPNEKNLSDPNNPVNKEDADLDRKIKSICRGC
ncbi:hypothetical protein [Bradyrhizobium sp. dw_78]|uniref:hypothetical protein n=1 Tax=Bradyrhizobium sp. dw_78 TaxID=2719793 RepID=UPI001BD41E84|nr:hypothetical protein [Bradyrhizobium sp. dw_78]